MDELVRHIKAFIAEDEKAIDEQNHRILFAIPEVIDRDDEIVTAEAIFDAMQDKKTFAANPICLPCHQHRLPGGEPPCVGSWDTETAKKLSNSVKVWLEYVIDTKLGEAYWKCYSKKHMRAISIGFRALEWRMEERNGKQIRIITKIELYEISCVAVGCNQGALSQLKSIGDWQDQNSELPKDIEDKFRKIAEKIFDEKIAGIQTELEDMKLFLMPDSGEFAEKFLLLGDDDSDSSASVGNKNKPRQNVLNKLLTVMENFKE